MNRYWKITDSTGYIQEVQGEGVIGKQPNINPNNYFEYSSGTPLRVSSGFMTGNYESENKKFVDFMRKYVFYRDIVIIAVSWVRDF